MKRRCIANILIGAGAILFCTLIILFPFLTRGRKDSEKVVFYGIVENLDKENFGDLRQVVNILDQGQVEIPETEKMMLHNGAEYSDGLESGSLIKLTFPEDIYIMEIWPAQFSGPAECIEVLDTGPFALKEEGMTCSLAFPADIIAGAEKGSLSVGIMLDFYQGGEAEKERFALTEITEVNAEQNQVWVNLEREQARTFLERYGSGVFCGVSDRQDLASLNEDMPPNVIQYAMAGGGRDLSAEYFVDGAVWDGIYTVTVHALSEKDWTVTDYALSGADEAEAAFPELRFSEECLFVTDESGDGSMLRTMSFEEFADLMGPAGEAQPCIFYAKFKDGEITEAYLP